MVPTQPSIAELEARLAAAGEDPVSRVDALNELAWALRIDGVPRSHALAMEARELAMKHAYKLGQARAARTAAMTMGKDATTVLRLGEEAKQLFDEVGDPAGRAASRDFLASVYEYFGELAIALDHAVDALSIARELGDPIRQGYALSNIGGILAASGEVDQGIERLEEALGIFNGAGDLRGVLAISTRLAKVLEKAGRNEEALRHALRCLEISEKTQNEWSRSSALSVIADLADKRGDGAEAERLYRTALDSITIDAVRNMLGASLQIALSKLLIRRGARDEAARELQDALRRVEGDSVSMVNETAIREALAEILEHRGELAAAIEHLRKAQALRERSTQRDARNKLAQVEARAAMDAAKKDAEIHKLRFVELHAMQSKLVETEKLALLGTLAAGAAHEMNSPLGVLTSNAQLVATATERLVALAGGGPKVEKLAGVLESCRRSTGEALERLNAVAHSFKRFAQLDSAERRMFDVREGLESALALLGPTIPARISVERRFEEVPQLDGWPRELNQAFMTVLENAVEAIEGAGVVVVETRATPDRVLVVIRDDGRGMSEEKAARLFDMAWSEQGARTKMRMGLNAAQATVKKHGGELSVESRIGAGTTMTFSLPISPPAGGAAKT